MTIFMPMRAGAIAMNRIGVANREKTLSIDANSRNPGRHGRTGVIGLRLICAIRTGRQFVPSMKSRATRKAAENSRSWTNASARNTVDAEKTWSHTGAGVQSGKTHRQAGRDSRPGGERKPDSRWGKSRPALGQRRMASRRNPVRGARLSGFRRPGEAAPASAVSRAARAGR